MGDPESLGSLHLIVIESIDASCLYGAGDTFAGTAAAMTVIGSDRTESPMIFFAAILNV